MFVHLVLLITESVGSSSTNSQLTCLSQPTINLTLKKIAFTICLVHIDICIEIGLDPDSFCQKSGENYFYFMIHCPCKESKNYGCFNLAAICQQCASSQWWLKIILKRANS